MNILKYPHLVQLVKGFHLWSRNSSSFIVIGCLETPGKTTTNAFWCFCFSALTVFPLKRFTLWSGFKFPNSCYSCDCLCSLWDHPTSGVVLGNQTCLGLSLRETLVDVSSISLQLITLFSFKCLFYLMIWFYRCICVECLTLGLKVNI